MKITSFRIRRTINPGNKMVGVASITLDNMIAIEDIKIINKNAGIFLAMPSRTIKPGTFKDSVHPINAGVRESIERIVFAAYDVCESNNYGGAQFDVKDSFDDSLLEQTLSDFILVFKKDNQIAHNTEDLVVNESSKETTPIIKKNNAFLDWLNN